MTIDEMNTILANDDYNEWLDSMNNPNPSHKAQVITFQHGTHTRREVVIETRELRNGCKHYITLDAYGNSKALFRYVPCKQRHIASIDPMDVPHLTAFMEVTALIRQWQFMNRTMIEVSETYGIGHDGGSTVSYGDVNIMYPSREDVAVVKQLYRRQAQLAALIRKTVNQVQKVSA